MATSLWELAGVTIGVVPEKPLRKPESELVASLLESRLPLSHDDRRLLEKVILLEVLAKKEDSDRLILRRDVPDDVKEAALLRIRRITSEALDAIQLMRGPEIVDVVSVSGSIESNRIDDMIQRASEVLGSRDEAMRWLGTPVRGLDFATPISLLGTKEGAERVSDILGQMERGVW